MLIQGFMRLNFLMDSGRLKFELKIPEKIGEYHSKGCASKEKHNGLENGNPGRFSAFNYRFQENGVFAGSIRSAKEDFIGSGVIKMKGMFQYAVIGE